MYGKFFASTFTGSMFGVGPDAFAVWGYVIANAVDSQVELNPNLLAAIIGTSPERIAAAIALLCAPDPRSRTKAKDGRRLIREGEYAYRVPNFMAYRSIRNEEDRRAYNREKQREHRKRVKVPVIDSQSLSALSAQAEADLEGRTKGSTAPKHSGKDPADIKTPSTISVEKPPQPPAAVAEQAEPHPPRAPIPFAMTPTITRFMARFYAGKSAERRADVARQMGGSLLAAGVDYKGNLVRAVDAQHLDECCREVMEEPPRDSNAAWMFVLAKLNDSYLEVLSARRKAAEPPSDTRSRNPDGLAGDRPAGASPIRAALAGVLEGLETARETGEPNDVE